MKKYIADTNFILRYLLADNKEDYKKTKIISLQPNTLEDVFDDINRVAKGLNIDEIKTKNCLL